MSFYINLNMKFKLYFLLLFTTFLVSIYSLFLLYLSDMFLTLYTYYYSVYFFDYVNIEYIDHYLFKSNIESKTLDTAPIIGIKFKAKRRVVWTIWEQFKGKHPSYEQFKKSIDSDINIRKIIKADIKSKIDDISYRKKVIFGVFTSIWTRKR